MENKLEAGNIISYGGMEWIVLDVEQEKVLVLARKAIGTSAFDENGSNDFAIGTLCKYLNDEFIKELEANGADTSAIVPAEDGADVFLLSVEEYKAYKKYIEKINVRWWLRTPGRYQNYAVVVLPSNSVERRGDYVDIDTHAVRPALWLKREGVQNRK